MKSKTKKNKPLVYRCSCGNEMAVAPVGIRAPETVECDKCGKLAKPLKKQIKKKMPVERRNPITGVTPRQEKFLRLYTQNDELFGNATLSYAEAYGYKLDEMTSEERLSAEGSCATCASLMLRKTKVQARKIELLNEILIDTVVDAKLAELIKGGDMVAIKEYNKLRGRITDKVDVAGKAFEHFSAASGKYTI